MSYNSIRQRCAPNQIADQASDCRELPTHSDKSQPVLEAIELRKDSRGKVNYAPRDIGATIFYDACGGGAVLQISNVNSGSARCLKAGAGTWIRLVPGSYALTAVMNRHRRPSWVEDLEERRRPRQVHRAFQLIND